MFAAGNKIIIDQHITKQLKKEDNNKTKSANL